MLHPFSVFLFGSHLELPLSGGIASKYLKINTFINTYSQENMHNKSVLNKSSFWKMKFSILGSIVTLQELLGKQHHMLPIYKMMECKHSYGRLFSLSMNAIYLLLTYLFYVLMKWAMIHERLCDDKLLVSKLPQGSSYFCFKALTCLSPQKMIYNQSINSRQPIN